MTAEMFISKELISKVLSLTDKVIFTSFFHLLQSVDTCKCSTINASNTLKKGNMKALKIFSPSLF